MNRTTYGANGQVQSEVDDSVYQITANPATGEATSEIRTLEPLDVNSGNMTIIYHQDAVNGSDYSGVLLAPVGSGVVAGLGVGEHQFASYFSYWNSLSAKVSGASVHFGDPYYNGTEGDFTSEGMEGPLNRNLFPDAKVDLDPLTGRTRFTQLAWDERVVRLPAVARGIGASFSIKRSHQFVIAQGYQLTPLFPDSSILETSLPWDYVGSDGMGMFQSGNLVLDKDDEATVEFKAGGTLQ